MNIIEHISELRKKVRCVAMGYYPAQAEDGTMTSVGFRSRSKDIVIDNISWMISGKYPKDVFNRRNLKTVNDINNIDTLSLEISLAAQAIVSGSIVVVELGIYTCVNIDEDTSTLNLIKKVIE